MGQRQQAQALFLLPDGSDQQMPPLALTGRVEIISSGDDLELALGQTILARGRLRPISGSRNPGGASAAVRYLANRIDAKIYLQRVSIVKVGWNPLDRLSEVRSYFRKKLAAQVGNAAAIGVLRAMLLGDNSALTQRQRDAFSRAGLSHLLAVSGLHLSLVALAIFTLLSKSLQRVYSLSKCGDVRRIAALVTSSSAVGYTLFTGASPSAMRACVMAITAFSAIILARRVDIFRTICLSALALLLTDPLLILRVGFQLSFAALVGLIVVARQPAIRKIYMWGRSGGYGQRVSSTLVIAAGSSIGAALLSAPLVAHHFGIVSIAGIILNIVAIPWVSFLVLPVGLAGLVLGLVAPHVGAHLLGFSAASASALNRLAIGIARFHWSAISVNKPSWALVAAMMIMILAVFAGRGFKRWSMIFVALGLVSVAWLPQIVRKYFERPNIAITFLDVGQGDSAFIKLPDGRSMMVDSGGSAWRDSGDVGARRVLPFLRSMGVKRLDVLVISHPDADHVAGAEAILEEIPVGEIWACRSVAVPWMARLKRWAGRARVPIVAPRSLLFGGAKIETLWPPQQQGRCAVDGEAMAAVSVNNGSIVMRISYAGRSAIFSGDIEAQTESRLVSSFGTSQHASILKVPHHGSATSSTLEWIRAVGPRFAVVSCGLHNRFGHPDAGVVERLEEIGARVVRSDQLGALHFIWGPSEPLRWRAHVSAGLIDRWAH